MRTALTVSLLLAAMLTTEPGFAQNAGGPPQLAKDILTARAGGRLIVRSDAFVSGQEMNDRFTQNGENMSPPLEWSRGPAGTRTYVILAEDASVNQRDPIVHWVVYDIPAYVTRLPSNAASDAQLPNGAMQGLNVTEGPGFIGPKPPAGETHAYHFQVFALNKRLNLDPMRADRNTVIEAMRGSVLASGFIVASYTGREE